MKKQTKVRTKRIIFILLIVLIIAHIFGYRIFGSPKLVSNQPFKKPQKLIDINSSGEVILKNNMKYSIYGIVIVLPDPFKQLRYFQLQQEHEIQVDKANDEMKVDEARIWYKHRNQYWCGNTWDPTFFPPRLYKYRKMDIAQILIEYGAAIPNAELFSKHRAYAKELMEPMRGNVSRMNILQNNDEVIKLEIFNAIVNRIKKKKLQKEEIEELTGQNGEALKFVTCRSREYLEQREILDLARLIVHNFKFSKLVRKQRGMIFW